MGSLLLRPGDSLTIPKMALSIGFRSLVSLLSAIQATGLLTLAPVGLTPTEHASLRWTHPGAITRSTRFALERALLGSLRDLGDVVFGRASAMTVMSVTTG